MKLFKNGKIITLNEKNPEVSAMLINDLGKIEDLGSNKKLNNKYNNISQVIDLKGKTVIPGLNDSHLHLYQYALSQKRVDLSKTNTIDEIIEVVKSHIKNKDIPRGNWIEGKGWNEENLTPSRAPKINDLDKITDKHPLILNRVCYHVAAVNSKALKQCNIDKNTPDPPGGKIGRDKKGNPNGLLYDNAIDLVKDNIPQKSKSDIKQLLSDAFQDMLNVGLTSIQVDDFFNVESKSKILKAYQELKAENKLPLKVNLQMRLPHPEEILEMKEKELTDKKNSELLSYGPVKIMLDGSLGARTAALDRPYHDQPENNGTLLYDKDEFNNLVSTAHSNGFQVAVHAIGDRAIKTALAGFNYMQKKHPMPDPRPIIVHAQISNHKLNQKMKKLGVVASIQPVFLKSDWNIVEKRVGPERAKSSYAWKTMKKTGVKLAGSSDAPIESPNPFYGIYAAVTRQDFQKKPAGGWRPSEKFSLTEALKLFSIGGAYQSFEEHKKGRLKKGYFADFLVLPSNIYKLKPEFLLDLKPEIVYVNGKKAYEK